MKVIYLKIKNMIKNGSPCKSPGAWRGGCAASLISSGLHEATVPSDSFNTKALRSQTGALSGTDSWGTCGSGPH